MGADPRCKEALKLRGAAALPPGTTTAYPVLKCGKQGEPEGFPEFDILAVHHSKARERVQRKMITCMQNVPGPLEVIGMGTVRFLFPLEHGRVGSSCSMCVQVFVGLQIVLRLLADVSTRAAAARTNISTLRLINVSLRPASVAAAAYVEPPDTISYKLSKQTLAVDLKLFEQVLPAVKDTLTVLGLRHLQLWDSVLFQWTCGHSWTFFRAISRLPYLPKLILSEAAWTQLTGADLAVTAPLRDLEGLQVWPPPLLLVCAANSCGSGEQPSPGSEQPSSLWLALPDMRSDLVQVLDITHSDEQVEERTLLACVERGALQPLNTPHIRYLDRSRPY